MLIRFDGLDNVLFDMYECSMFGTELRAVLNECELSQVTFAKLVGVTARAVNMWAQGEREIPGPVEAYLRVFQMLPISIRQTEIERATGRATSMREGMYQIQFHTSSNPQSWGIGTLVFGGGTIYGVDTGGAKYDGNYTPTEIAGIADVKLKVSFPPNVMSIFGIKHPYEWSVEVRTLLDSKKEMGELSVSTNIGANIVASYQFLRSIPEAA